MAWGNDPRAHLDDALRRAAARARGADAPPVRAWPPHDEPPPLEALRLACGLTSFEVELVSWAAAADLLPPGEAPPAPCFAEAFARLGEELGALDPERPLRKYGLVLFQGRGASAWRAPLVLDERVLRFLVGVGGLDEELARSLAPAPAALGARDRHLRAEAGRVVERLERAVERGEVPIVQVVAERREVAIAVAVEAATRLGLRPRVVRGAALTEDLAAQWAREQLLEGDAVVVDVDRLECTRAALALPGPALLATSVRVTDLPAVVATVELTAEPRAACAERWARLGGVDTATALRLAATFDLSPAVVEGLAAGVDPGDSAALWAAARAAARVDPEPHATWVRGEALWEDLVLPDTTAALLRELVQHHRHRATVLDGWGMRRGGGRGEGLVALFAGPSGTGKTLAAEVVANALGLDLWRVDLAAIMSKYIGETEKNLARVFDLAERGAAVLLFDEADAVFGKRAEVRDASDRYANLETSYLLQRIERYRGVVVLTTNLRGNVDHAFLRRFSFVLEFGVPGAAERRGIWARVFPPSVPTAGLDIDRLSNLVATGAVIRNIALRAAFLAASEGAPVTMGRIARAARADYAQREQRIGRSEIDGWD